VSAPRCPYCFTDLDATEPEVRCARCRTPHHQACFREHGKCVVLACNCQECFTTDGRSLQVRRRLEVSVSGEFERHPFLIRAGYRYGDPRWLEIEPQPPELARVPEARVHVGLAGPTFLPGEEVVGQVSLHLPAAVRARAVRLVLRTTQTTPGSILPTTLLEREAVIVGYPWEGHLKALGLAVRTVLGVEREDDLTWLVGGITRWNFRFRIDPLHPVRPAEEPVSVLSEVLAYVDLPAASDLEGRCSLHVARPVG
jgi:hypothetical protein